MTHEATIRNEAMFIKVYEGHEPKIEHYENSTFGRAYLEFEKAHKQWQSSAREYRVREKDRENLTNEVFSWYYDNILRSASWRKFNQTLEKGIDCTFLADRLKLEDMPVPTGLTGSNKPFEKQWTLLPLEDKKENDAVELINKYFDGLIQIDKDLQSKDKSQLIYDMSVANINQLNMIRETVIEIFNKTRKPNP